MERLSVGDSSFCANVVDDQPGPGNFEVESFVPPISATVAAEEQEPLLRPLKELVFHLLLAEVVVFPRPRTMRVKYLQTVNNDYNDKQCEFTLTFGKWLRMKSKYASRAIV